MPIVFIISGYAYAIYVKSNPKINLGIYIKYAQTRMSRIYIPYFAYALICAIIVTLVKGNINIQENLLAWLNPFTGGKGHSISSLSWHLWFIPHFLIVTLLLPVVTNKLISKLPLVLCFLLLCLFLYFAMYIEARLTTPAFYFFWAYIGYKLGGGLSLKNNALFIVIAIATSMLAIGVVYLNQSLNMQLNKFPPNLMFLWFSCIWVSLIFLGLNYVSSNVVNYLLDNKFVALFVKSGYSIYLWQGIGYASAKTIQSQFNLNIAITWFIAIVFTVILGVLFSPLERIKWSFSRISKQCRKLYRSFLQA
jgi:peptidoglycan/LPS O-acetylase OafA/YrhL